jgi:CO/xanthine dehydrogenase Mo-binding subunit
LPKNLSAKRKLGKGKGIGIAAHRSFLTYVARVVEVEVFEDGTINIPRVDTLVDTGLVVNPEGTRAQFEGAAVFGTSVARSGDTSSTATPHPQEWENLGFGLSFRRWVTQSSLPPENGSASCR